MKTKDFELEIKAVSDEGVIEGYGSVFGNVDSYGEKIAAGSFAESLQRHRRRGTSPLMLWQHDPGRPIGVWEDLAEDGKGLWGKGRLILGVPDADTTHKLLKAKALRGLSIGYREQGSEPDGAHRLLTKLDLLEISIVSFPANELARIDAVKSDAYCLVRTKLLAGERPTKREFEKAMRDAFDLSNSEAERAVKLFQMETPGEPGADEIDHATKAAALELRAAIAGFL